MTAPKVGGPIPHEWRAAAVFEAGLHEKHIEAGRDLPIIVDQDGTEVVLSGNEANRYIIDRYSLLPGIDEISRLVDTHKFDAVLSYARADPASPILWATHRGIRLQRLAAIGIAASYESQVIRRFVCTNLRPASRTGNAGRSSVQACNAVLGVIVANGDHHVVAVHRPRAGKQAKKAAEDEDGLVAADHDWEREEQVRAETIEDLRSGGELRAPEFRNRGEWIDDQWEDLGPNPAADPRHLPSWFEYLASPDDHGLPAQLAEVFADNLAGEVRFRFIRSNYAEFLSRKAKGPDGHEEIFDAWPIPGPAWGTAIGPPDDDPFKMGCTRHGRAAIEMGNVRAVAEDGLGPDIGLPCTLPPG